MLDGSPDATARRGVIGAAIEGARAGAATLLTLVLLLAPGSAAAQEVIIEFNSATPAPAATNVCETGDTRAAEWMSRVSGLSDIKRTVDEFSKGTGASIDPSLYYSEKSATGQARGRANWAKVQSRIASIQKDLEGLGREAFTDWQPACEACNRFRSWWSLFDISRRQAADLLARRTADGSKVQARDTLVRWRVDQTTLGGVTTFKRVEEKTIDVRELTQEQVEFQGGTSKDGKITYQPVAQLVSWYNTLVTLRPTADQDTPSASACLASMLPADTRLVPTVKQCRVEAYEQGMDFLVGRLVNALEFAKQSAQSHPMRQLLKDSKRMYDTACPTDSYPNNWRLRDYE